MNTTDSTNYEKKKKKKREASIGTVARICDLLGCPHPLSKFINFLFLFDPANAFSCF